MLLQNTLHRLVNCFTFLEHFPVHSSPLLTSAPRQSFFLSAHSRCQPTSQPNKPIQVLDTGCHLWQPGTGSYVNDPNRLLQVLFVFAVYRDWEFIFGKYFCLRKYVCIFLFNWIICCPCVFKNSWLLLVLVHFLIEKTYRWLSCSLY